MAHVPAITVRGCRLLLGAERLVVFAAFLACPSVGHAQSGSCLRDTDGDGHPLFGNPQVRPFPETAGGLVFGNWCTSAAFADLDGDGDADGVVGDVAGLPATGPIQSFVAVFFNAGDGVFEPGGRYPVARRSCAVECADLDGDGDADIATAGELEGVVSILLNNGDGTFSPFVSYPVGQTPCSVKIADVDGDADPDVVVLNWASNDVSVLKNEGAGLFAPEVRVFVGSVTPRGDQGLNFPYPGPFLAVGDVDRDGDTDVAVPARTHVKLLLNDGAGGFMLAATHPSVAVKNAYSIVISDLDGDADMDLASSSLHDGNLGPNVLSIIRNQGAGAFAPPVGYDAGWVTHPSPVQWAASLTGGDIDNDTDIDLVVGHEVGGAVMLLRNRGDGTYGPKETLRFYDGPWYVRLAEVNGDGRLDLTALTFAGRPKLCIALNDGAGSVMVGARYPAEAEGQLWNWVEAADLDSDEDVDLVAANQALGHPTQINVLLNNGKGAFDDITPYALGTPGVTTGESVAIGDLNGDGLFDLAVADAILQGGFNQPGKVWIMSGRGDGSFAAPTPYALSGVYPQHIAIADLDGDRDNDLAVWSIEVYPGNDLLPVDRRIAILWNIGPGVFQEGPQYTIGTFPYPFTLGSVVAADFDGDAAIDLAATASTKVTPGVVVIFRNVGGLFERAQTVNMPPAPWGLATLDLDHDGDRDLVVSLAAKYNGQWLYLRTLLNDGAGGFRVGQSEFDARSFGGPLSVGFDPRSGRQFIAMSNDVTTMVRRVGSGGELEPAVQYGTGNWPTAAAFGDFDNDTVLDLASSNAIDSNVSVLLNRSCGSCYADCDATGALTLADFACFQTRFARADPYADCDANDSLTVADFGCFQTKFVSGCP